jgi:hypothetical protein
VQLEAKLVGPAVSNQMQHGVEAGLEHQEGVDVHEVCSRLRESAPDSAEERTNAEPERAAQRHADKRSDQLIVEVNREREDRCHLVGENGRVIG